MAKKAKTANNPPKTVASAVPTRNKGLRRVRVADIENHEANFRLHPIGQREAFDATVEKIGFFGYQDVYETPEGKLKLIDGQLRKEHLIAKYGEDAEIEVNVTDFSPEEARIALATHDPLSALAESDAGILEGLLQSIGEQDGALKELLDVLALDESISDSKQTSPDHELTASWSVLIECNDEAHQLKILEEMTERKIKCRALIV